MNRFLLLIALFPSCLLAQTLRRDLQSGFQKLLCNQAKAIPSTAVLWREGIFDTQLDAAFIRSGSEQQALIANDVAQIAADQALAKQHQGFAFGLCSAHEAWIVSLPSAEPLMQKTSEGIEFNLKAMRTRCKSVSLHYAKASRGSPKKLFEMNSEEEESITLHPELLEPGTVGLTCHPADQKNEGPELWSLLPIHEANTSEIPFFSSLGNEGKGEGTGALIAWIQKVRAAQGLKPLRTEVPLLRNFANQLASVQTIRHPHAQLLKQRAILAKKKIQILGENRVKATSNQQMAWLLWYSPTHRQLLLHKNANSLGFDVAHLQQEKLLVLVLAKI